MFNFNLQYWNDEYLKWNTTKYPSVTNVNMPVSQIWSPKIDVLERYVSCVICIFKKEISFQHVQKLTIERTVTYQIISIS